MLLKNPFLKATPLYKEYAILEFLSKDSNITQRAIAKQLDSSLSMVNQYLEEYEKNELLIKEYKSTKYIEYKLTRKGHLRLKELNIKYLESIRKIYLSAKGDVLRFLYQLVKNGYRNILLYGAGEVAELTLQVLSEEKTLPIYVKAIVDDDESKQNTKILGISVISSLHIKEYDVDGIFISSYGHSKTIKKKLLNMNYSMDTIFDYFE
jgi:predicted transcriptional regulator